MNEQRALITLGLKSEPTPAEIREAYISKVKQSPPETHPVEFQRIQQAYDSLRDPREQARRHYEAKPEDLAELRDPAVESRCYVGPGAWTEAMSKA